MKRPGLFECDFGLPCHRRALLALIDSYMADPMGAHPPHDKAAKRRLLEALAAHPSSFVLFATTFALPVGVAICFVNYSTFSAAPFVNIHDLAVLPAFRGKRLGKLLIDGVTLRALELGCARVTLEVREDNAVAHSLYAASGFTQCSPPMYYLIKTLP